MYPCKMHCETKSYIKENKKKNEEIKIKGQVKLQKFPYFFVVANIALN